MDFKIEDFPVYRVAFLRSIGAYGSQSHHGAMHNIKSWANANGLMNNTYFFGIPLDDPAVTAPEKCRYNACVVINDYEAEGVATDNIAGGKYAVFSLEHTKEAVMKAWQEIFSAISSRGLMFDNSRNIMERYTNNQAICEICIPIKS